MPAHAQGIPTIEIDVMTDYRERGLSYSDGELAGRAYVSVPISPDISVSAQAATLRGSDRHGGADAGIDLAATWSGDAGILNWHAGAVGHLFTGAVGNLDYVELRAGTGVEVGPADVGVRVNWAPSQDAIGGSNLYTQLTGHVGIWGSPLGFRGHVGHSSGSSDGSWRSERLRPGGDYTDWSIGTEYYLAPITFSLDYSDTDINRADIIFPDHAQHYGEKIVAGALISF